MTRQELIAKGKVWLVYPDADPDAILFECGSRTAALRYIREHCGGLGGSSKLVLETPANPRPKLTT